MTDKRLRGIAVLLMVLLISACTLGTVYADQPYRGQTRHKRSLRDANIRNAEDEYTDIDGKTKDADKDTVSISFTSDMEQDMEQYARVATYFKAESGHYPRSFMLDAGNYSSAGLFQSVFAKEYPGINAMGAAGYDIVGIGFSEVAQGGTNLALMLDNASKSSNTLPYVTSANVAGTDDLDKAFRRYGINDYLDMNKYRTEVAVFSIVGEDAFNAAAPDKLRYEDAVKTAKSLVDEIKRDEDADMIICMCASGILDDDEEKALEKEIARKVKGIDIIISAGSTTDLEKPLKVGDTRIYSLAAGSGTLGRIEYKIVDNHYEYSGYKTITLDKKYKKDKEVMKRLDADAKIAGENYFAANGYASGQVLCDSFFEIAPLSDNAGKKGDSPLGELIADAYRYGATEDAKIPKGNLIAMSSDLSATKGIKEGKIKINDVYDIMAVGKSEDGTKGQSLVSFYLTGKDVRTLAEIAATAASDESHSRLYFSGMNYKYNPNRFKDKRIYDITVLEDMTGGQIDLKDDSIYRIVTDKATAEILPELTGTLDEDQKLTLKDENGKELNELSEMSRSVIKGKPLKTWVAVAELMKSFNEAGIPATYRKADGRMEYDDSKSFSHVYKGELFTLLTMLAVALIGVAALIVLVLLVLDLLNIKVGKKGPKKIK